eukprot:810150-Pleurochrysis_carterae.AAC.6
MQPTQSCVDATHIFAFSEDGVGEQRAQVERMHAMRRIDENDGATGTSCSRHAANSPEHGAQTALGEDSA